MGGILPVAWAGLQWIVYWLVGEILEWSGRILESPEDAGVQWAGYWDGVPEYLSGVCGILEWIESRVGYNCGV